MKSNESMVLSVRVPVQIGEQLVRFAERKGWTLTDAGAHLVEEGLKRWDAIDYRDSPGARVSNLKGNSLTPSELIALVLSYDDDLSAVAWHLGWSEGKLRAALDYAESSEGSRSRENKDSDLG